MGDLVPANEISEEDYQAIQEAVMETARGRWFLAEYARRNRVSDTDKVLDAIDEVKTYITREHEPVDVMQMRLNIVDMTQKIEQIKTEIANIDQSSTNNAQVELNVVLDETEKATSTILASAEEIQGLGWEIRERSECETECDKIDELATEIYMACSFQDLTGQRLRKVVQLTEMLEDRLNAMVAVWDESELARYRSEPKKPDEIEPLTNGPAMPDMAQGQDIIDEVLGDPIGLDINNISFDEIEWRDDDVDFDSEEPFIIDDDVNNTLQEDASSSIEPDIEFDADDNTESAIETETDDVSAFEADAEEEVSDAQDTSVRAAIADEEPENASQPDLVAQDEEVQASQSMDDENTSAFEDETGMEDMEPLEERVAVFN